MTEEPIDSETKLLLNEGELGADYIEQFLDILDFDGDIDIYVSAKRTHISITDGGDELQSLIGKDGQVLDALQELTRLYVQNNQDKPSLLMLDILNYRKNIRDELSQTIREIAQQVLETKTNHILKPMNAFERKVVHDTVAQIPGVFSESHGFGEDRHVVISLFHD